MYRDNLKWSSMHIKPFLDIFCTSCFMPVCNEINKLWLVCRSLSGLQNFYTLIKSMYMALEPSAVNLGCIHYSLCTWLHSVITVKSQWSYCFNNPIEMSSFLFFLNLSHCDTSY